MNREILFGAISILIFTISCRKQDLQTPPPLLEDFPNCRLIEIQDSVYRETGVTKTIFEYDHGLLTKKTIKYAIYTYDYEDDGNVINMYRNDQNSGEQEHTVYTVKNNQIQSIIEYDSQNEIFSEERFFYSNHHLITVTRTNQYGDEVFNINTDEKGNIISSKFTYFDGVHNHSNTSLYTYDDKLNPFYGFPGAYEYSWETLNQNNMLSSMCISDGDTVSTSHWPRTYYVNRLLRTRLDIVPRGNHINTFIYDCE